MGFPYIGLLVLGFGGHARSVADVALAAGCQNLRFCDKNARPAENFAGHPVVTDLPDELEEGWACFPASGDSAKRMEQIALIRTRGWRVATIIAADATVGVLTSVQDGCFLGHHAHLGPRSAVGEGVIINTGAVVEHDCRIGAGSHISVHATIAGGAHIGKGCFICAGSTVIDGIRIGANITLGAGATAVSDLSDQGTYVGTPARLLSPKA